MTKFNVIKLDRVSYSYKLYEWPSFKGTNPIRYIKLVGDLRSKFDEYMLNQMIYNFIDLTDVCYGIIIDISLLNIALKEVNFNTDSVKNLDEAVVFVLNGVQLQSMDALLKEEFCMGDLTEAFATVYKNKINKGFDTSISFHKVIEKQLIERSLSISNLRSKAWLNEDSSAQTLYLKFIGKYSYGEEGNLDSKFINWEIEKYFNLKKPSHLIIDLCDFEFFDGEDFNVYPSGYFEDDFACDLNVIVQDETVSNYTSSIHEQDLIRKSEYKFPTFN